MWLQISLALLACSLSVGQSQFQNFGGPPPGAPSDQGRSRAPPPPPQQSRQVSGGRAGSSGRDQAAPGGGRPREDNREVTTPVPILKQINEHNEDGSYTYGYEAADGTFKLETRFQDGSVQGKYGYIDVNGEVKIIEYGANAMGFQPQGDLPEGIIIPPPVEGNCTECDYDYDYVEEIRSGVLSEENSNLVVQNRARGNNPPPSRASPVNSVPAFNSFNSQNRGQQLDQPITPAPLPRQQAPASFPTFSATAGGRPAAAVPSRQAAPAVPSRQAPAVPSRQAPAVPSRQAAATPSRQAPSRGALPSAAARQPQPASVNTNFRPTPPSANFRPTRPAAPPAIPPVRKLPDPVPSSTGSRGGGSKEFSNFPARDSPARPRGRPSGTSSQTSQRFQAVPANPEPVLPQASVPQQPSRTANPSRGRQRGPTRNLNATPTRVVEQPRAQAPQPAVPQPPPQQQFAFQPAAPAAPLRPAFEDVSSGGAPAFSSFQSAPNSQVNARPALTFAEPQPVPANLPKSALEIVDFNQLVQEFQGSLRPQPQNRFQNNVFSNPPNTQTRFSTDNFPVRF